VALAEANFLLAHCHNTAAVWLSGIGGLDYWPGILDWNTGMT